MADVSSDISTMMFLQEAALIEGDGNLLDYDIMDDDELNEEIKLANQDIDSNSEDMVLKTPPSSIKWKSPEPTAPLNVESEKVVLKRKLNISVSSTSEASSITPMENKRKIAITCPTSTTLRTNTISNTVNSDDKIGKKIMKFSQFSTKERLELRAKKFGAPVSAESTKAAKSERFGLKPEITASLDGKTKSNIGTNVKNGNISNIDILSKRAQRFGGSVSKGVNKIENLEKLQEWLEGFGKINENNVTVTSGRSHCNVKQQKRKFS